jgi:twinkle protein
MSAWPEVATYPTLTAELIDLWEHGLPAGDKTGWPSVDRHYTVAEGQFTIVTGWPGSGKSEWLDALLVNLSHQGWKFALFSPENHPIELHVAKFMEKLSGKPFGHGPTERITSAEILSLMERMKPRFGFMSSETGDPLSVQTIIETATPWLDQQEGKRGLVIDPWNELEHWRPKGLSETEYISQQLSHLRAWARHSKVHVWLVAHPQKVQRENGKLPVPRPDMIAGSQHWWNKADNAMTVWRDMEDPDKQDIEIHVQKVRFKHIGRPGVVAPELRPRDRALDDSQIDDLRVVRKPKSPNPSAVVTLEEIA